MDVECLFLNSASSLEINQAIIFLALVILFGLVFGQLSENIGLPPITGYIIAGVVLGGLLVFLGLDVLSQDLDVISRIGLGFVAYQIGSELLVSKLRKTGKEVVVIALLECFFTVSITFICFYITSLIGINISLASCLLLAAIATATAPAPIMLIIKKYKCKGPITNILLPLVGMDDAIGIMIFGISLSVATSLSVGGEINALYMILEPLAEIVFSIIIGAIFGYVLYYIVKTAREKSYNYKQMQLGMSVFTILVCIGIAEIGISFFKIHISLSAMLTPMFAGFVFANLSSERDLEVNERTISSFQSPLLVCFFTLAGVQLVVIFFTANDVNLFVMLILTFVYILGRSIGKITGAGLGSFIMKSHANVRKYLGCCLLPHAGVAIGMAFSAKVALPAAQGTTVLIVVLIATLAIALFGPTTCKVMLDLAGENTSEKNYISSHHDTFIPD